MAATDVFPAWLGAAHAKNAARPGGPWRPPSCPVCLSGELVEVRMSVNAPNWARYRCGHEVEGVMAGSAVLSLVRPGA
ncbi:hypothetical protein ACFOWE_00125 [Planomonospora corallina]|uniref:Uncharacterized protein n=1 Tax=Planomonospora corallina TaxID=1806052 RepID=A0ABV8HXY0_9ACTN